MTPEDMEKLPKPLERLMADLEMNIMAEVVDRIKDIKKITPTINYLLDRVYDIGVGKQHIKDVIDDALADVNESIDKVYKEALQLDYARNSDIYKSVGKDMKPYSENKWLQQLSNTIKEHTKGSIENITKTTGFNIIRNGQKMFAPLEKYLTESLDRAMMNVTTGSKTYTEVINETVDEMTKSGLRTVDYASGRKDRIDVAVRRAILTGVSQLTSSITEQNMKELGTDYAEVDWHLGARNTGIGFENHQSWQGKVYSKSQLKTICGFGDMLGLHGINCRHIIFPFIPGISKRKYTDEWLEEQNRKENEKKDYKGKEFDTYEASQRQRLLERTIKKYKQDIKLLERAEADKDIITLKRAKLKAVEREYVDFSKAMGLKQQGERLKVGVGNNSERGISSKKGAAGDSSKVDLKYINSKQYKAKFKTITDNQDVNESIYQRAKAMLIHRNGTRLEDMYLLDKSKGEIVGSQTSSSSDYEVEYNKSLLNAVSKSQPYSLISIHNHPTNIPPSGADFASAGFRRYKMGVIACHNGDIYTYEVGNKPFSGRLFDDTVEKYMKMGYTNGVEANIKALEQFEIDYGIKWRKL